jgi:ubiquinone/menaquinone biosynthesis C-methylase UbiE
MAQGAQDIPINVERYDSDYTFQDDVPLVETIGKDHPGEWLEMACGTGRIMIPLAEKGHTLTGVDHDPRMLDQALDKIARLSSDVRRRLTLVENDMCRVEFDRQFSFVYIPFNSLLQLPDHTAVRKALGNAVKLLKPGGRLLVWVMNPSCGWWQEKNTTLKYTGTSRHAEGQFEYDRFYYNTIEGARQNVLYHMVYDDVDADGKVRRQKHTLDLLTLTSFELQVYLEDTGLMIDGLYGEYDLRPYETESALIVFTGTKPTATS